MSISLIYLTSLLTPSHSYLASQPPFSLAPQLSCLSYSLFLSIYIPLSYITSISSLSLSLSSTSSYHTIFLHLTSLLPLTSILSLLFSHTSCFSYHNSLLYISPLFLSYLTSPFDFNYLSHHISRLSPPTVILVYPLHIFPLSVISLSLLSPLSPLSPLS